MNRKDDKKRADESKEASAALDFGALYTEVRDSLARIASRYFRNTPHDVEDIVQDAFVKVMEAQRVRDIRSPEAYIHTATRNLAISAVKKSAYRLSDALGDLADETVISEDPLPDAVFESRERFELFCRAVRQLPPRRRRAFILARVYGLSYKEIAARMNIGLRTAEAHVARGIVECTDYMDAIEANEREGRPQNAPRKRNSGSGDV